MLYPNRLQAALLFDRPLNDLETIARDFARIEGMKSGAAFNIPEANPGRFYRLFNGDEELMLTFEYVDGPANVDAFRGALSSSFTGLATPDIRARIARTQSHILVEASHGVMAGVEDDPEIAAMFAAIGRPRSGASSAMPLPRWRRPARSTSTRFFMARRPHREIRRWSASARSARATASGAKF